MATRSAPLVPSVLLPTRPRVPAPVLTATVADGALVLAGGDGQVRVRVPLEQVARMPMPASWERLEPDVAHVCVLDSALARRLFRRVSAWHVDAQGQISARVRPTA